MNMDIWIVEMTAWTCGWISCNGNIILLSMKKVMWNNVNILVFIHFNFLAYTVCVMVCSSINIQYKRTGIAGPLLDFLYKISLTRTDLHAASKKFGKLLRPLPFSFSAFYWLKWKLLSNTFQLCILFLKNSNISKVIMEKLKS